MEQMTRLKGICRRFTGTFQAAEWEKIVFLGKSLKKAQVKNIHTVNKRMLTITCESGVLNILTDPTEKAIYGNLMVRGCSVDEITRLPLWKLFQLVARSFRTDGLVQFYPTADVRFELSKGILQMKPNLMVTPGVESEIDQFLRDVRLNFLLQKLFTALKNKEQDQVDRLKAELKILQANHQTG